MIAYLVTNTVNGKRYVGISRHNVPDKRWREHLKQVHKEGKKRSMLHLAILKYGVSVFTVEHIASARTWDDLCATEVVLISQYGTFYVNGAGYNMTIGGDGTIGVTPSAETRAKNGASHKGKKRPMEAILNMRAAQQARIWHPTPEHTAKALAASTKSRKTNGNSPEHNARISLANAGRKHTPEAKQKMNAARTGSMLSQSHKKNIANSLLGIKRPLEFRKKMSEVAFLREAKKRLLVAGGMAFAMIIPFTHAIAQIEVRDTLSLLQEVKGYLLEIKGYALQSQQYLAQAQQLKTEIDQYVALVHDPSLGAVMGIMGRAGLGNDLPVNPYAMQSLTSGAGGLMGRLGALGALTNGSYTQNHIYTPQDGSWNSQQLIANGNAIAGTQGAAQAAYQDLRTHLPVIQALRDRLLTARTPKDVEDATAQLQAETLWTHSLNSQLAAIEVNYRAQQDARAQRDNESLDKGIDDFLAQAKAAGRGL